MNLKELKIFQASLMVLQIKIKNYHWNIQGKNFFEDHEQLDDFYEETVEQGDTFAEKIVMFDQVALGSFAEALPLSFVKEVMGKRYTSDVIYKDLISDLEKILDFVEKMNGNMDFRVQPIIDELVLYAHKWVWKFKKSVA
ncbi:Dps family protein [Mycoplasmopsis sturni]|uniref:Dps family protein n=1 Tax=Mycoplasmopsis sturni TaxID=39047 RepID=UPI000563E2C3|nr:DNA starvation/stationary phase protection protein [Mycoplasmopsis sturni]